MEKLYPIQTRYAKKNIVERNLNDPKQQKLIKFNVVGMKLLGAEFYEGKDGSVYIKIPFKAEEVGLYNPCGAK